MALNMTRPRLAVIFGLILLLSLITYTFGVYRSLVRTLDPASPDVTLKTFESSTYTYTTYSRFDSNIDEYLNYELLDLRYATYSATPNTSSSLPTKRYLRPRAPRKSGWEIGRIFSASISGEEPFTLSPGSAYASYPRPYVAEDEPVIPSLIFHDAEANVARVLSSDPDPVWIISDLYVEEDYVWFYYLLASDVALSEVWRDPTTPPEPARHVLNTNRFFQRRYNLRTLEADTTELCLPDGILGQLTYFNVYSPESLLFNTYSQGSVISGGEPYMGLCHADKYELLESGRKLDPTQPAYEVPKRLIKS